MGYEKDAFGNIARPSSDWGFEMPDWMSDINFMDKVTKDANGASITEKGLLGYGGDIMSAYTGWKGLGLAEDTLEEAKKKSAFAQKEYWTDLAMNRDILNRKINNKSALSQMYGNINAGRDANSAGLAQQYNGDNAGAGIIHTDGSMHNVVDIPREHLSSAYNQMTPGAPAVAGNSAFAQPAVPGVTPLTAPPRAIGTSAYAKSAQPVGQTSPAPNAGQNKNRLA